MSTLVENVTCLGCGCACDDIAVRVHDDAIVETRNLCPLGERWMRPRRSMQRATVHGDEVTVERALAAAAKLLGAATRPAVLIAPGLSCEEQRTCVALADVLRARLDTTAGMTALPNILAGQERGFASATFGEIRNRADLIVYWAIDVATRYPRFVSRYAPRGATVAAVDVGSAVASVDAGHRFSISPADELTTLLTLGTPRPDGLGALFDGRRYIALVYDAEPDDRADRSPQRFDALVALAQSLNDRTRCASIAMRGYGNGSGADSVCTAATGFPTAIDFAHGAPRYRPHDTPGADVRLVVGDRAAASGSDIDGAPTIVIGPNATESALGTTVVAVDSGAAGIHTAGTAIRADDVPLPLRPALTTTRSAGEVLHALLAAVR